MLNGHINNPDQRYYTPDPTVKEKDTKDEIDFDSHQSNPQFSSQIHIPANYKVEVNGKSKLPNVYTLLQCQNEKVWIVL